MPARADPIDAFVRDFGRWFHAPRVDVLGDMRIRLMFMLAEAENRGRAKERTGLSDPPMACGHCGRPTWERVARAVSADERGESDGRRRALAFVRGLEEEGTAES